MEGDLYCSWCGATLVDLKLTLEYDYLYAGDPKTALKLEIMHSGAWGSVKLQSVKIDQPWMTIKEDHQARTLPNRLLHAGEFVELTLEADLAALSDDYPVANITVMSNVGPRKVAFEAVPRFTLDKVSTGGEHTVWLDNLPEEKLTGYLAISSGVVTIESLRTDVDWATVKPIDQTIPCRLDARRKKRLEFQFEIDEPRLMQEILAKGGHFPAERCGNVVMKFANMEDERSWPFYTKCFLPPKLNIPGAERTMEVNAFVGRRAEFGLTLENFSQGAEGHADLQILGLERDVPWLNPTSAITYPLTIPSGQFQHVTFAADVDKLAEGSQQAKLTFLTNSPGSDKQKPVFIELNVQQMQDFNGVLAIDFGTTNSCCSFIDKRGRDGLIEIGEGRDKNTTNSSAILYKDLFENGQKFYEIGSNAYEYSFMGAFSRCAVKQVKRSLGKSRHYEIRFQEDSTKEATYTPRQVTTDILRRILEQAEDRLRARIRSCTVAHPSRFSVRQIDDLKSAIAGCGIEDITLVHEPIGAALDFIRGEEIRKKYKDYHLMVFDFGGGTIDVTLLRVVNERRSDTKMVYVKPDVLGVTGDPEFGGENVTDLVLKLIHTRCEEILVKREEERRKKGGANTTATTKCLIPIDEENFEDSRYKSVARQNRPRLRAKAEVAKIAIALYGDSHVDDRSQIWHGAILPGGAELSETVLFSDLYLNVVVDNVLVSKPEEFKYKDIVPSKEQIEAQLRPKLSEIVASMKALVQKKAIDAPEIILLSGKSSALPIVKEVISDAFASSTIAMPKDLKECVVRGACVLTDPEPREGVSVQFDHDQNLSAMTSSLGISVRGENGSRFRTAIEAGEPMGKEGVRGVLKGDVEFTRRARITIYENTGFSDKLVDGTGKDNPNITELKTFKLESKLAEWERIHDCKIDEAKIAKAQIELEATPNFRVRLTARIPGIEEPFEFEEVEYIGG